MHKKQKTQKNTKRKNTTPFFNFKKIEIKNNKFLIKYTPPTI